jgi:mono/diheme cytochrome c family protein
VLDVFCAQQAPRIDDLVSLQKLLGYDPFASSSGGYGYGGMDAGYGIERNPANGAALNFNAVLLGLSTALSGQLVSPINPRAILISSSSVMAFQRGVQRVELAARDRERARFNFYLLEFAQACNEHGCSNGDLYTQRIEQSWASVSLHDDEELKNTPDDCRQCHQRKRDQPTLLMRELSGPWLHFFTHDRDDQELPPYPEPMGRDLVHDYRNAKGEEGYAGLPIAILRGTVGLALEQLVGSHQPVIFPSGQILNERWVYGDAGWPSVPARSASWDEAFAAFTRGEQLAWPHYQTRPTDADKQARLSAAYSQYRDGKLAAEQLPDLSDIFPDDPTLRAEIGLQTSPDATPAQVLIQACGSCHNDVLDQAISRARFSVDLTRMDEAERKVAIERLMRAPTQAGVMPPPGVRQLTPSARAALIAYLRSDTHADAAQLARAAQLGMAIEAAIDPY